jgi:hypothetical protein
MAKKHAAKSILEELRLEEGARRAGEGEGTVRAEEEAVSREAGEDRKEEELSFIARAVLFSLLVLLPVGVIIWNNITSIQVVGIMQIMSVSCEFIGKYVADLLLS